MTPGGVPVGEPVPDGAPLPDGVSLTLVPWDHPDAHALRVTQQDELRERYGQPAPEGEPPAEQMLATVLISVAGQPAGCGSLRDASHLGGGLGEIKRMFVAPDQRGQGLARHVLAALERIAVGHHLERLVLETGVRQPEAIRLYRAAGYRCIPSYGVYADDPESVCYARWLDPTASTRVLLVNGTVGAGKTAIAAAVGRELTAREVPHAVLDLDALTWAWPLEDRFGQGLVLDGLSGLAPGLRRRGYRRVVLARVVEDPAEREAYERALDGADVTVVRVTADAATRERRIAERETRPDARTWHLERSVELEQVLTDVALDDAVVDTTHLTPEAAATQVLDAAGW